jgi:hypothetical protein
VRTLHSKSRPAAFYPLVVTRSELGVQSAKVFSHLAATCASRLYPSASTEISLAFDHAWFFSHFRQMTNPTTCVETALSLVTVVCGLKRIRHRLAVYIQARLAFVSVMFNVLMDLFHHIHPDADPYQMSIAEFSL